MQDSLGLHYTTSELAALERFELALEQYLASSNKTMQSVETTLTIDPDMPMALVFRGYLLKLAADPKFKNAIAQCCDALKNNQHLNAREAAHAEALNQLHQGQLISAVNTLDALLQQFPMDMLALRIAHYLHFYCAGGSEMKTSLAQAVDLWRPEDPFYGYLKGMQSFALEESGQFALAEQAGRLALEHNPGDLWAAHALTHVCQMQSLFSEGIALFKTAEPEWKDANNFVFHLYWHKALLHLGNQQYDEALALYDSKLIAPLADDFYLDICNATSLLWRFETLGLDVGDRWNALAELSRQHVRDNELVFTTLHYLLAPARLGDHETVTTCLQHFDEWQQEDSTQGRVAADVGANLAQAISMISNQQPHEGAELLTAISDRIHLIGGSHAQRQLFDQHLITHHQN